MRVVGLVLEVRRVEDYFWPERGKEEFSLARTDESLSLAFLKVFAIMSA